MKRKMNLCYTIKIRYLIKVIYFPLDFPLEGELIQQVPVSRETSIHIRHRKTGDVLIQNGHRKNLDVYLLI